MAPTLVIAVTTTWVVVIITEVTGVTMPTTVADGDIIIMAATAGIIMMGCVVTIGVIEKCHLVVAGDIMVLIVPMGGVIMALNGTAVDRG